jgi:hypothetical protein
LSEARTEKGVSEVATALDKPIWLSFVESLLSAEASSGVALELDEAALCSSSLTILKPCPLRWLLTF